MGFFQNIRQVKKIQWLWIFLTSVWLVLLTVGLQYLYLIRPDEIAFLKVSALIRHNLLGLDRKPAEDSVIFINVSRDLALTDDTSRGHIPDFNGFSGAKILITDRKKLARLFQVLNQHPDGYKFLLCDILLDVPDRGDSSLKKEMHGLKKEIFAADASRPELAFPRYSQNYGTVTYMAQDGSLFTKMPVFYKDTLKSLPAKMYEMISGGRFIKEGLPMLNNHPVFNEVLPEFYYRKRDLLVSKKGSLNANYMDLTGLLVTGDTFFNDYLKGKYIVVGNFETDNHHTYLGDIPGPLILWNTYLTLTYQPPFISFLWLLWTWLYYTVISYTLFVKPKRSPQWYQKAIEMPLIHKVLQKYISYLGTLVLLSLISLLLFHVFISVFYVASFLTLLSLLLEPKKALKSKILQAMEGEG